MKERERAGRKPKIKGIKGRRKEKKKKRTERRKGNFFYSSLEF
jgi:hypothetical protein